MEINGKYGSAIVYNDTIEQEAISQIINLLNQEMAKDAHVRIMPDVHAGAGCVIGYTAKLTEKVVPNLIGVDIGCGVTAWKLGPAHIIKSKFDKLDKFIRKNIPSGRNIHTIANWHLESAGCFSNRLAMNMKISDFFNHIKEVCSRTKQEYSYVESSLGTLGGGNHFIEIDKDYDNNYWLIIHSGSRNFGLKVAKYHQSLAQLNQNMDKEEYQKRIEIIKKTKKGKGIEVAINALRKEMQKPHTITGLEYLEGDYITDYLNDMQIAQLYAKLNRRLMGYRIITKFYKLKYKDIQCVESVHNYINLTDRIIRKGAISAHENEMVIIPLNMADGCIVGTGKGNSEWNNSAPHGAGRKMSRNAAKANIDLSDYQKIMQKNKVWTSCISKHTLDEAPQAYKKASHIIEYLKDTVEIYCHMKPVYNFKADS